jgi:hypothetical protein
LDFFFRIAVFVHIHLPVLLVSIRCDQAYRVQIVPCEAYWARHL